MDKSAYEIIQIDEKSWKIEENGVRSLLFTGTEKSPNFYINNKQKFIRRKI